MGVLPERVMKTYRSAETKALTKRHWRTTLACVALAFALVAMLIMKLVSNYAVSPFAYLFIMGLGMICIITRQAIGEILAERQKEATA